MPRPTAVGPTKTKQKASSVTKRIKTPVQTPLQQLTSVISTVLDNLDQVYDHDESLTTQVSDTLRTLYEHTKHVEPKKFASTSALGHLLIDGFDESQIWAQHELHITQVLKIADKKSMLWGQDAIEQVTQYDNIPTDDDDDDIAIDDDITLSDLENMEEDDDDELEEDTFDQFHDDYDDLEDEDQDDYDNESELHEHDTKQKKKSAQSSSSSSSIPIFTDDPTNPFYSEADMYAFIDEEAMSDPDIDLWDDEDDDDDDSDGQGKKYSYEDFYGPRDTVKISSSRDIKSSSSSKSSKDTTGRYITSADFFGPQKDGKNISGIVNDDEIDAYLQDHPEDDFLGSDDDYDYGQDPDLVDDDDDTDDDDDDMDTKPAQNKRKKTSVLWGSDDEANDDEANDNDNDDDNDDSTTAQKHRNIPPSIRRNDDPSAYMKIDDSKHVVDHLLTPYIAKQQQLSSQISAIEAELAGPVSWDLKGEVGAYQREKDSLVHHDLEHQHGVKLVAPITSEVAEYFDTLIKSRIRNNVFDNVTPRIQVEDYKENKMRDNEPVSAEKPRFGLAEMYEKEYLATSTGVSETDLKLQEKYREIAGTFAAICHSLDAMCNFYYTAKPQIKELNIVGTATVTDKEDILPTMQGDTTTTSVAPQELHQAKTRGLEVAKGEMSVEEKSAAIRRRKDQKKKHNESQDNQQRIAAQAGDTKAQKRIEGKDMAKTYKQVVKSGKVTVQNTKGHSAGDNTKYNSLSAVAHKAEENTRQQTAAARKEKRKQNMNGMANNARGVMQ